MKEIYVGGTNADFATITEAIDSVPYEESAVIHIAEGVYHEKLFSEKKDLTLIGEAPAGTIIEFGDGAFDLMPDGSKRGTFRSYTAFFGGERVTVKNMTIINTAGDGRTAGQALAVYADAAVCCFENVYLLGHQDTLFMSPLPMAERQKGGFTGPREDHPRLLTRQYYKNCKIFGDVDFIFGGADAVFDDCVITCNNRQEEINGYITAPSETFGSTGMIFRNCRIQGAPGCEKASVFLGRPWRNKSTAVFLKCTMDDSINPLRFSGWGNATKEEDAFFGEYRSVYEDGRPVDISGKNPWLADIDDNLAKDINTKAQEIVSLCTSV